MFKDKISVSAPGRLCLLGEHQDYFGLSIIAAAINLRISITGKELGSERSLKLDLPDIGENEIIPLDTEIPYSRERDYLKSAVNILQRQGVHFSSGWDCQVKGTIPINSGTASSSALVVAWIQFLLESAQDKNARSAESIAELAFQAEVAEFKEPGGKMDHYAAALGGIVYIDFGEKFLVEKYSSSLGEFVLADSLIRKDTTGTLGFIKKHVHQGLAQVQKNLAYFHLLSPLGAPEIEEIKKLPPVEQRLLLGTIKTRDITREGRSLFKAKEFNHTRFGKLLSQQQDVVRDDLQISAPKIDLMIDTALQAGALGAKINGSGEGGCILAYAPDKAKEVSEALSQLDTKAHIIRVDEGVRIE